MQVRKIASVCFVFWSTASLCMAGEWVSSSPTRKTFYSKNRRFAVAVVPRQPGGQVEYFDDGIQERPDAGAAEEIPNYWPRALLYSVQPNGDLSRFIRDFKLVNEVAPETALISDDGRYLVTFGNWGSSETGSGTIVIYRTDGALIRSLALADVLTANDLAVLPRAMSSIDWGGNHFIDEDNELLVLQIQRCTTYNSCLEKSPEVAIQLADGDPLDPPRDLLPQPIARLRPPAEPIGQDRTAGPDDDPCGSEASFLRASEVSFQSLQATAIDLEPPSYTELARKARLVGSAILEILVQDGAVSCVKTIKDLPMGLGRAAREAALQWRFSPAPDHRGPVRSVVAFEFSFDGVPRDPAE